MPKGSNVRRGPQQAWREVDEVVVLRMIAEPRITVRANKAERMEAARRMLANGRGSRYIAPRVGLTVRTVERYKQEMGLSAPPTPPGTTRELVRRMVLADPRVPAAEVARKIGRSNTRVRGIICQLQRDGELPPRNNQYDVRNPRNKGIPRYGVPLSDPQ